MFPGASKVDHFLRSSHCVSQITSMAGIEAIETPSVPIVLRVKRKRAEDPADALGELYLE